MRYAIEMSAWSDETGTNESHYFGKPGFVTSHLDDPRHIDFLPLILNPGNFEAHLFRPRSLFGRSETAFGFVDLANIDGYLDNKINAVDGREIVIRRTLDENAQYPDGWDLVFRGIMLTAEYDWDRVRIKIRDRQAEVADKPWNAVKYAGDNSLPNGVEGVDDLKGKPKPRMYGVVRTAPVPQVNTSRQMYEVCHNPGTSFVIDDSYTIGASIVAGTDHASLSALEAATVVSGEYDQYEGSATDGAYIKTGSDIPHDVTVDATEGAAGERTVAQVTRRALKDAGGLTDTDLGLADFDVVDGQAPFEIGIWVGTSEARLGDKLDEICQSGGAISWFAKRDGKFGLFRLDEPAEPVAAEITESDLLKQGDPLRLIQSTDTPNGIPPSKVIVEYRKNYRVYTSAELDGATAENTARAQFLKQEYRETAPKEDADRLIRNPLAEQLIVRTLLDVEADANTVRDYFFNLIRPGRQIFEADLNLGAAPILERGQSVRLTHRRYGLSDGKLFRVIGFIEDHNDQVTTLILWG